MKLHAEILKLSQELKDNSGVMPDSWKPYASLLIALLTIAKLFTNDATDAIIDEIILAIKLAESL